ncbi:MULTISPECIES: hypothetical protein [Serratia]|uniref:hypothetical protein n=1 Tax=Serratia TaxID=613 RepID=UPI0021BD9666|nr:hypothetical protein [Serratia marcescens]MDP8671635.1 hypothetical protein [Serratia marcescens]MDP8696296.1 hypothetical protein [Serratia marcescens]MDP8725959.1 hypothetical protein [Serratia marcescens]
MLSHLSIQPSYSEAFTASLSSGWHDRALVSYFRNLKLDGVAAKSSSEFIDKSIADQAFMNYGVGHVNAPEHGIKKDVFNAIIDDRISQIYNEKILCGVVDGIPISYLSATAGFISFPVTLIVIILIALILLRVKSNKKAPKPSPARGLFFCTSAIQVLFAFLAF